MRGTAFLSLLVGLLSVSLGAPGCGSRTIRLGNLHPLPYAFGTPALVPELADSDRTDNPTLTADMLEIYFTNKRDVWSARRTSILAPFDPPALVEGINSDGFETSPAISADGLILWFGSDRSGGSGSVDIWVAERRSRTSPWSTPMNVVALNSAAADIPRSPGQHGLVMPMASTKITPANPTEGNYQTYRARRSNSAGLFGAPEPIPELAYPDRSTVDAFLTDDGLAMFFSSAPATALDGGVDAGAADGDPAGAGQDGGASASGKLSSDLYVAFRRSTDEPFAVTQALTDLNTSFDERDPWLSPDGRVLYFTSDRDGPLSIYRVSVGPR